MSLPKPRNTHFHASGGVFGLKAACPAGLGSNPDAAGSLVCRRGSSPRPAGSSLRPRVSIPAAAGAIPQEMGWLPAPNGSRPAPRGIAPADGGIHPAPQTRQPAARGIKPAGRGIEPKVVRTVASRNVAWCCIHLQSLAAQGFGAVCALRPIAFSGAELHVFRPWLYKTAV